MSASTQTTNGAFAQARDDAANLADADKGDGGMIVAPTERASRAARSPPPSGEAQSLAWQTAACVASQHEARGLLRMGRQPVVLLANKHSRTCARNDFVGSLVRPAPVLSHVFSLQRPIDANSRESSYLTYQSVLPLESFQLAAAGMRSNSVRASLVHKPKKTQGGGQQTTRNNLQELAAAFASQSTAVAVTLGYARCSFGNASDPGATTATNMAQFVDGSKRRKDNVFVATSSTRLLPHALPVRVGQHNLLATMQKFANAELEMGAIRSLVPQQVASLRSICVKICDKTDGVSVWAAWVLLIHMLSDPRLRNLVRESPITDHEVSVAYLFTNYARAEVTRRARMEQAAAQKKTAIDAHMLGGVPGSKWHTASPPSKACKRETLAETKAPTQTVQAQLEAQERSDKQTLSLKRKRPPCSGVVQVSGGVLDYWAAALGSEYASILKLMITQSKSIANQASVQTLTGQAPPGFSSDRNALLVDISTRNAVKSAEALAGLVITSGDRVPKVVAWRCRNPEGRLVVHTGIARSASDASNTTIHAASMAPAHTQESTGHTAVVWSMAVRNSTPFDLTTTLVPSIVEGILHVEAVKTGKVTLRRKHFATRVLDNVERRTQRAACDGSLDVALTGVARSFIVLRAQLVVSESQLRAGREIGERMRKAHQAARESSRLEPMSDIDTLSILSEESLSAVAEPFATPSNNLALALEANEQVRVLFDDKSHRNDPCRHLCGVATASELSTAVCEERDRPQSLLPIVDCVVDFPHDAKAETEAEARAKASPLPRRRDACLRTVAIKLTVCGDAPVRLPELLDLYAREQRTDVVKKTFELLSLLFGGAARASEVNDVAAAVSAGHVNSSISCAKRILVGDLNMRLLCTLYQVYRVGTSNVPRSFETTPWSGVYGAGFDIGTSGGIGVRASSLTADNRKHGKILMAQQQVDRWCAAVAQTHYTQVSSGHYAAVPREARGVPHATIPGLHAYLDEYADGLEHARALIGVENRRTVDSLQCLPLSPFAERQAPHISEGSDPTVPKRFRNPDDAVGSEGRAFQVDATCSDVAILREPLVPCASITSPQDCIFGQSQPFLTSVIGAAAALARLSRSAFLVAHPSDADAHQPAEKEVHFLYTLLKAFYDGSVPPKGCSHYWAATAAVLLNSIYTSGHQMAQLVIADGNAKAPAACAKLMRAQERAGEAPIGAPLQQLVSEAAYNAAATWWEPFTRAREHLNAWVQVCPLIVLMSKTNGSLDLPIETYDDVSRSIQALACSGAWLHASSDGILPPKEPSPLAGLRAASHVRSEHLTPTFVGKAGNAHDSKAATACIVGVLPMGFQQILALLQGASNDGSVVVNYAHNFSFLIYRPSAAPDIVTSAKKQRSSKAISCVNVEGDEAAFGTRADKLVVCKLHRIAWRTNLDLVQPICLRVATPRPDAQLSRGDRASVDYCKQRKRELDADRLLTKQQVVADDLMKTAILGRRARDSEAAL